MKASTLSTKITDRVQTFDDILSIANITLESLIKDGDTEDEVAYKIAKLIAEVYNEGTVLNPNDTKQVKYFPWFEITPNSGFGLSSYGYVNWYSFTIVGVRLCFKESGLAIDAGKKFTEVYATLLIK